MNVRDAEIIKQTSAIPAIADDFLESNGGEESRIIALADKLDAVVSTNSDIVTALGEIKKDTRFIPQWLKKFSTIKAAPASQFRATPTEPINPVPKKAKTPKKTATATPNRARKGRSPEPRAEVFVKTDQPTVRRIQAPKTEAKAPGKAQTSKVTPTQKAEPKQPVKKQEKAQTASQKALDARHAETERVKDRKLLGGVKDAMVNVGSAGVGVAANALQDQDLTDIVGTAVGGPLWDVVKEVKEVKDNTDFGKLKNVKGMLKGRGDKEKIPAGAKRDAKGRLRDAKGHYIATKGAKSATKPDAKTRVRDRKNAANIEEQKQVALKLSDLGIQTVESLKDSDREEDSRHKELIAAVKGISMGGKLGMLRRGRDAFRSVKDRKAKKARKANVSRGKPRIQRDGIRRQNSKNITQIQKDQKTTLDAVRNINQKPDQTTTKPTKDKKARPGEMVERKRRKGAMGTIKTPKAGTSLPTSKSGGRGKIGKIAGLIGGLGIGGGLLSGLLGGEDSPVTDMVTEKAVSSTMATAKAVPAAAKPATQTASKVGLKGAAKLGMKGAGFGLRALGPLAAVGMAGYDAFQGWNDKDMQARAFDLKEGQEATTGQKASSSLANVLDMGGLGTGLLSMFGIDTDTADIAKGIHGAGSWIGGALGLTDEKDGEKDAVQQAISEPIATVTESVKSIFKWLTGQDEAKAQVAVAAVAPQPIASQKSPGAPVTKIHKEPLPKVDRIKDRRTQPETAKPGRAPEKVDNTKLNRLIRALEKNQKAPSTSVSPDQQPTAAKSNLKADFEDSMLTLMAYDRI